MTVQQLKDQLAAKGLSTEGIKAELEERLNAAIAEEPTMNLIKDTGFRPASFLTKDSKEDLGEFKFDKLLKANDPTSKWRGVVVTATATDRKYILGFLDLEKLPALFPLKDGNFHVPNTFTMKIVKGIVAA